MNNKGFMMAEVVVVSSIILVTLVGLYTSYNKIISIYNQRVNYYDVSTLYDLAYVRDLNDKDGLLSSKGSGARITNGVKTGSTVYLVSKTDLSSLTSKSIKPTFKEYINYLKDSKGIRFATNKILVMEKCKTTDNCTYAYLEVY